MDGTHIGHLSYVGDSIIGANCNFGAGTITANLRFDDNSVKVMIKDKLVDSGKRKLGAIIGDYVKTGINVNFMPGVKIEPNAWISPNVVIQRDVSQDSRIVPKQDLDAENSHKRV
jgi:bifunctional UDP-N-acetylglucosamine pyrophosphorylase/glucosamine-1-phosphate N-acetyltransferase